MKKTIRVYTNLVFEGWSASDLETGIGGSEEKLIEWARELSHKYDITIYHNGVHGTFDGVKYEDYNLFKPWIHSDIFISFKSKMLLLQSINADKIIHWTSDIEDWSALDIQNVDSISVISDWHKSQMNVPTIDIDRTYIWADLERLDKNKVKKKKKTMLYCASFDRGLEDLLKVWGTVKNELNLKKLYIAYGWESYDLANKGNANAQKWKEFMIKLMDQDGIEMVGRLTNDDMCKLYWKSQYWCLPCNAPKNELFCINAVKAQYCGCIPVVRRLGGMQETVNEFIDFDSLVGQQVGQDTFGKDSIKKNKKYVKKHFDMKKQIKKWGKILG